MWTILRIRQLWANVLLMLLEERLSTVLPECSLKFPVDLGLLNQTRGLFHIRFLCELQMSDALCISSTDLYGNNERSSLINVPQKRALCSQWNRHDTRLFAQYDWWHFAPQFTAPSMGKMCDNDLHPPPPPVTRAKLSHMTCWSKV